MATLLSLNGLKKHVRGFEKIASVPNDDISFEIDTSYYRGAEHTTFVTRYRNISSIAQIADICAVLDAPFLYQGGMRLEPDPEAPANVFYRRLVDAYPHNLTNINAVDATKLTGSPAKFWAGNEVVLKYTEEGTGPTPQSVWGKPTADATNADKDSVPVLNGFVISGKVPEVLENGVNYRILKGNLTTELGESEDFVFVVTPDHPTYVYLDQGHAIFFVQKQGEWSILITDSVGLDMNYIVAAFTLNPSLVAENSIDKVFIRNNANTRMLGLKVMQSLAGSKHKERFEIAKKAIFARYESNAQQMMTGKLLRGESAGMTLNEIKFTQTRAEYNTVSIEADDLSSVVFQRLDVNAQFDIYQVIQVYVENVMDQIKRTPTNEASSAFTEAKQFNFRINDIPIRIEICTTNTRRKVNGHYINTNEVARVIGRAACNTSAVDYNNFVKAAARLTLETRDILANGLPIKVQPQAAYNARTTPTNGPAKAIQVVARMKFVKKDNDISLALTEDKSVTVPLRRFVSFYRAVAAINEKATGGYGADRSGGYGYRNADWARREIKHLIELHCIDENDVALTTAEQRDKYIDDVLILRTAEEKKSLELLEDVAKKTKAEYGERERKSGYYVTGKKTRYFVEFDPPFKVWEAETGRYVCIVDHNRENMGVGYDGLVARLLMLVNDARLASKVTTVAALV